MHSKGRKRGQMQRYQDVYRPIGHELKGAQEPYPNKAPPDAAIMHATMT